MPDLQDYEAPPISMRVLAAGDGWSVSRFICRAGPGDRSFEERHEDFSVAAVISGQFDYRGDGGAAHLVPGAMLTGNAGRCFRCSHEHVVGDECVSLSFRQDMADEAAAAIAGRSAFAFEQPSLPPSDPVLPIVARFQEFAGSGSPDAGEDLLWWTLERLVAGIAGRRGRAAAPNSRETSLVAAAIKAIDDDPASEHSLEGLARDAGLSRFHFLRLFRRVAGATPRQYLIQARMRRAAARLSQTRAPVTTIALDSGFGDLSTFNRRFRSVFGVSPRQFRVRA